GEHTIRLDLNGYFKWKNASEEKGNIVTSVSYEFEISKQQLALPTLSNFAFTGLSYGDAAALQELGVLSGFDSTKMSLTTSKTLRNADTYTVTIAIKDEYVDNYEFAQSNGTVTLPLAALLDGETDDLATVTPTSSTTLDYTLTIHRAKLASPKAPNCPNITYLEDGTPMYVLPAEYTDNGAEVVFGRMVYDSAASQTALADGSEIEKNKDYWYVFSIGGKDANNFEFDGGSIDKNGIASSTRDYSYAIPLSGAAAFFQNVMTFLKSWWWILLIALALLLLILIIVIAVKRKKKKQILIEEQRKREFEEERIRQEQLEEQRRADAEAKEERKREEERRREEERKEEKRMEREERMAELRSQQMMQHMMPQMPPQMMQQPQIQQQPQMPQMPQMPMMPQMMMPQMMQQFGGGDSAADEYQTSEAIRIAEERTRAAEDRARLAEERIARIAQEAQNQAVSPAYPQMPMLPNGMPMNGMYPGMQPQMPMQPMMPQMPMVQQPLPQTAPTRDTTVKITENAANMLGEAIVSSLTHMILGNNNSNAQQQAPQAAPAAQAQQPAMSVQINMPPTAQPAQQPTVTAQPAQQSAPQSENQPAQQPAESGNNSDIPRRRLRL
ncbi:MAG: PT domain-containing protein, partial [Clostridia bacterium]|nr:PT domain-containing protein [Clostridia bacterium]